MSTDPKPPSAAPYSRLAAGYDAVMEHVDYARWARYVHRLLAKHHGDVDVLVGGPPCQGHSDFNNRTRHADDKNELYGSMVRAAEVLAPQHILIENVPGALNDKRAVVQRTAEALGKLGYHVSIGVIDLSEIGVPHVYLPDHNVNMVFLQSGTPGDWALGEFWGPIANETRAWLDHLATGRACTLATPQDARATLEATLAIEHSMRIGAPVTLPLRAG